jgi:hypothetical protein
VQCPNLMLVQARRRLASMLRLPPNNCLPAATAATAATAAAAATAAGARVSGTEHDSVVVLVAACSRSSSERGAAAWRVVVDDCKLV